MNLSEADKKIVVIGGGTGSFTGGNDVVIQAIPEPSTCLLMGIGALGVMGWLRRFRRMS